MAQKNVLEDIELRSESVQEVLSNPPAWIVRYGISIVFVLILLFVIGCWFIKYPDVIVAKAVVTSHHPPEKLESKVNSRIVKLCVANSSKVKRGTVLAILESSANYEAVLKLDKIITSIPSDYQSFYFPFKEMSNVQLGDIQSSFSQFHKAYIENELNQKLHPYSEEINAGKSSQTENNNRLAALYEQQKLEKVKLSLSDIQYKRSLQLFEKGVISKYDLDTQKANNLQAKQAYDQISSSISQQKEAINQAKKQVVASEISQEKTDVTNLASLFQALDELKKSIHIWKQNYLFEATYDGVFKFQNSWQENQLIKTGDLFATILPENQKQYFGSLKVPLQNSGKIQHNQKVLIKLDNFPFQEYGMLEGRVQSMSTITDPDGNYFIEVIMPKGLKTSYGKEIKFDKELTGSADIITDQMRLIERVFYQFRKLVQR
ncbi:HlyD family secretion protein [Flavobacterium branchiicola]|uniref:HlyD family secretion protein n=1 Tax=Flavobacterium branchiicola TaxID=1114875 RepID=A0ABV9P6Q4_9FLAO|nr:HlyD family efflux transporter periplasmic adaptor subunit [Flavobacterium branchiicola]MBS7252936.1 HlyD family efflux transporter periplasmic adaptor subunit [Flavobacterium branchiicola]